MPKKSQKKKGKSRPEPLPKDFLDMIAPAAVKFNTDHFILGNAYHCVMAVRGYSTMEEGGKVTDAYDVDLDRLELSAVRPSLGWVSYRLKDASTAVWHADRCGSYDWNVRKARFMEKLAGREIASAGHLSAENFSFADEITADDGRLNFYLENSFDMDRVFGTHTAKGDDWLNIYASYDMAAGQVCDMLEVDLHQADGREESLEHRLNAVEKSALLQKMDAYCQQQTGQSLKEYSAQCMAEDMAPPAGPVM